jgi:membrane associated rhomboid family serine protease
MGIYDREYYRGESGGAGFFGGVSPVCNALIAINIAVYVLQHVLKINANFIDQWLAASPDGFWWHGRIWQLLTATFIHDSAPFHILGNMLFLWFVGREIEGLYGSRDFLAFYLMAAVLSTFVWILCNSFVRSEQRIISFDPNDHHMIGASGAVMAVVTLFALYYPHRQVLLFFVIPLPIWVLVVFYLFFPLLDRGNGGMESNIAIESHLAGAAFAVAYKYYNLRWSRLVARRFFSRPRLRIFSPTPHETPRTRSLSPSFSTSSNVMTSKSTSAAVLPEEQLNAQLDEVLAKIAREGRDHLTEEENRVLQEASRRARIKRSDRL